MAVQELELVSIDMGYGHLRPAFALSRFLQNQEVLLADQPPLASPEEQRLWSKTRLVYEGLSRAGKLPLIGGALSDVLDTVTKIPAYYPRRDLSGSNLGTSALAFAARRGLGAGLAARLQRTGHKLLTSFYAPAVLSDLHGCEHIHCIVTDSDIHRIWAPQQSQKTRVHYLAPTPRARRRLKAYGVPAHQVVVTGFPLPHELVGGPGGPLLRSALRRRLPVLDLRGSFLRESGGEVQEFLGELLPPQQAPHLTFAVGGAGAQAEMAFAFLPSLAKRIRRNKLRVSLVAGIRTEVARVFEQAIVKAELKEEWASGRVQIILGSSHSDYFEKYHALLHETDVLWTKPSEMSFFAALGLPLVMAPPLGSHEYENRRWVEQAGAGVRQQDPHHAGEWLWEMLKDGTLAGAAWSGYLRLPKYGLYRVVEEVLGAEKLEELLGGPADS